MKKRHTRLFGFLLALVFTLTLLPAVSAPAKAAPITGQCGDNVTWELEDRLLTFRGTGSTWDFDDDDAGYFQYNEDIISVIVDGGVTRLGNFALYDMPNLLTVMLPYSFESLGDGAFRQCGALDQIRIPPGVTYIGQNAFLDCDSLNTIYFDGDAPDIAYNAFAGVTVTAYYNGNSSWEGVAGKDYGGDITWRNSAPDRCGDNVTWSFDPDSGVLTISGTGAMWDFEPWETPFFDYVDYITSIVVEEGVTALGKYSLMDCCCAASISLPNSLTSIGKGALSYCEALTSVLIPRNVTEIGQGAFAYCSNLSGGGITFNGGAPSFDPLAFEYLETTVEYPAGNNTWTPSVIQNYGGNITWMSSDAYQCGDSVSWYFSDGELTIFGTGDMWSYPEESPTYEYLKGEITSVVIEPDVTSIGSWAFYEFSSMKRLWISNTVTYIGNGSFSGCTGLDLIVINSGVETIVGWAFAGCTGVTDIVFEGPAPEINFGAFENITATAFYPANDSTWTSSVMQDYGGDIRWCVSSPPTIDVQPANQTVAVGSKATFKITSPNATAYRWQWSDNGTTWKNCSSAGYNTDTFSFNASASLEGRQYRCVISNVFGSRTSDPAVLRVKPAVTKHPSPVTAAAGSAVSFKVTASGPDLGYQWQYSKDGGTTWKNCSSAGNKTDTFAFTASSSLNGWMYRCVVSNSNGSATSNAVKLTVTSVSKPTITTQPTNQSVTVGSKATFKIVASGATSYQWQWSANGTTWTNCKSTGYNTATFAFTASASLNGRQYRCVVTNSAGSTTSNAAKLTVTSAVTKPTITTQPTNKTVTSGTSVTFKVVATGTSLTYQWQWSGDNGKTWKNCTSTGYNTASFSFKASAALNGRMYRCVVKNSAGSVTSTGAKLTVSNVKPAITVQPTNKTATAGTKVSFSVIAAGSGLKYQWQWSADGTTWTNCKSTGYNTATFTFTASASLNNRQYRCVVSNSYGSTTSTAGKLTVK